MLHVDEDRGNNSEIEKKIVKIKNELTASSNGFKHRLRTNDG